MSQIPLPSTAALKRAALLAPAPLRPLTSALDWLANKLDPLDSIEETEISHVGKEDEIEREHEEEERLRERELKERRKKELVEMSRVVVPVLPHEVQHERVSRILGRPPPPAVPRKPKAKRPKPSNLSETPHNKPSQPQAQPRSQAPAQDRLWAADQEPERMIAPTPPSAISSLFELAGSEFLTPTKSNVSPRSQPRVEREVREAIECGLFNMWPTFEDPTGRVDQSGVFVARNGYGVDESGVFVRDVGNMKDEGKGIRMRIETEWKAKKERSTEGRRRVKGPFGYESVMESEKLKGSEWGFQPTLGGVVEERTKRKEKGRGGSTSSSLKSTATTKSARMFLGDTDKENRGARGYLETKPSTSGKEDKSRKSMEPPVSAAAARAMRIWAARDLRKRKASTERKGTRGNESDQTEKHRTSSQSQSRNSHETVMQRTIPKTSWHLLQNHEETNEHASQATIN
ncbi:hypothetical protein N431DRAFT_549720 [Stipitochalara longipes BDJ]|nr:hypothetical protein N431DRAFT_549720 [Stipitochalara longipes BDJ]